MIDFVIYKAHIADRGELADVLINEGKIIEIRNPGSLVEAKDSLDAKGALLSSGFVDSHTHLDTTNIMPSDEFTTLSMAIKEYSNYVKTFTPDELASDITKRARETLRMAVVAGTTSIRTHISVDTKNGLRSVEALNELRNEMRPFIDIHITAYPIFHGDPNEQQKRFDLLDTLAGARLIDAIGGAAHLYDDRVQFTHKLFKAAVKNDIDVDLHIDEHDDPNIDTFLETARITLKYNYEGRVSCSHVTALSRVEDNVASKAIAMAKESQLSIITLPSCNLYLMSREDHQPIPRGVTRIREFLEAGVNITYASDNIRDFFRPIGNADMLEEGLLTAQVAQMLSDSKLQTIHKMGTTNAAHAMRLWNYGLGVGKQADLVLLDAPDIPSAYRDQATRLAVIKNGHIVAKSERTSYVSF